MHPGITNPSPRKGARLLVIDTRSPHVGRISPPYRGPNCDRPAYFEYRGKLFDVHGREIVPGVPLPPEESDPRASEGGEVLSPDAETIPASQLLARIGDLPIAKVRALAGKLLGEDNIHRTRSQIAIQLREFVARTKVRKEPNSTRLARAQAARDALADAAVEQVEVPDYPDA